PVRPAAGYPRHDAQERRRVRSRSHETTTAIRSTATTPYIATRSVDTTADAYPNPRPTPGDVCKGEAERLNQLGLGNAPDFELLETRVERVGDEVRLTHLFRHQPTGARLWTEPFQDYR